MNKKWVQNLLVILCLLNMALPEQGFAFPAALARQMNLPTKVPAEARLKTIYKSRNKLRKTSESKNYHLGLAKKLSKKRADNLTGMIQQDFQNYATTAKIQITPFESKNSTIQGIHAEKGEWYAAFRIGHLFFIHTFYYYEALTEETRKQLGSNVILLSDLVRDRFDFFEGDNTLGQRFVTVDLRKNNLLNLFPPIGPPRPEDTLVRDNGFMDFTFATIVAMLKADFTNKYVVEAGAGNGILSLVAAKLGASYLTMIDSDNKEIERARTNLRENGLIEGKHFKLIHESLKNTSAIMKKISNHQGSIILITNIGKHFRTYGFTTNATSLNLISDIERNGKALVTDVFLGGYVKSRYKDGKGPQDDLSILQKYGFLFLSRPQKATVYNSVALRASRYPFPGATINNQPLNIPFHQSA